MSNEGPAEATVASEPAPVRRLRRADRREQILDAATRAFARAGFAATSLDDVAAEAGITRFLLYRHFDSKADMYRAVLDRACRRLEGSVGSDDFDEHSIPALLRAAAADPDAFRLLFRYAAREPEFRDLTDGLTVTATDVARDNLAAQIPDRPWLDTGQPDPEHAAGRIGAAVHGVIQAAQTDPRATRSLGH